MDLSIIIVNYNVKEFLQNLLYSIQKAAKNVSHEVIIIDNASDDGSVEFIKEKFREAILVENKENVGFGRANNIGLRISKGNFILLLNPDTIVSEDTFLKVMDFCNKTPDAGLVGCKILNPDGTLQLACRRGFPGPWTSFCKVSGLSTIFPNSRLFARYNLTYLNEDETYEVDAVSGSFMMLRREVYDKIGGFDEDFYMYGEDLDLCYRIQKVGYKVFYFHETQIIHYKGESTRRSSIDETKYFYDAMHLFVKKHLSTSFLVELILRGAIVFRKLFAFLGRIRYTLLFVFLDFIFFDLSLFAGERIYGLFARWYGFPSEVYFIVYFVPAFLQVLVSSSLGLYKTSKLSVLKNIGAVLAGFVFLSAITYFFKQYAYSRAVIIISYTLFLCVASFWRMFVKLFTGVGKVQQLSARRTLLVGTKESTVQVAKKIQSKPSDYHMISGLIGTTNAEVGNRVNGLEVVGSLDNIGKVINEKKIREVIFIPDEVSYTRMMSIVSENHNENVEFKLIGNNLDFLVGKKSVLVLDDLSLIDIQFNVSKLSMRFIKRTFDLVLALVALFFIYPFIYLTKKQTSDFKKFILGVPSVIRNKVSFVGPPENAGKEKMFLGKRGLTGFWFTEGGSEEEQEKLNIFYAKNQSIWLDLEILGKTINKFWSDRN